LGPAPFVTTYDLIGNKIDSIGIFSKTRFDIGYEAMEYFTINTDGSIVVIDSTKTWDLNEDEDDIVEGTMKLNVGKTIYLISESGKIMKE